MPFGCLLEVFLPIFRGNHPFHAFTGFVRPTWNFLKGLVQGEIVPDGVL